MDEIKLKSYETFILMEFIIFPIKKFNQIN